jgi:RimJ/RimL family protein N-acetyltransferase
MPRAAGERDEAVSPVSGVRKAPCEILTPRLRLVPVDEADEPEMTAAIFADPEVVKGLAHDGSTAAAQREASLRWCRRGPAGLWAQWEGTGMGLYAVRDRAGLVAAQGTFLGVAGLAMEEAGERWDAELFYAYGRAFHGRGVGSEAAQAVTKRFAGHPLCGALHAGYWHLLNPASGAILRAMGFVADGFTGLIEEYGRDRLEGIRRFELWRLERTVKASEAPERTESVVDEVGVKLGHLAREGVGTPADCAADMMNVLDRYGPAALVYQRVEAAVERGATSDGMAHMVWRPPS